MRKLSGNNNESKILVNGTSQKQYHALFPQMVNLQARGNVIILIYRIIKITIMLEMIFFVNFSI